MIELRIVCAANLVCGGPSDGLIVLGVRHYCPVMRAQIQAMNLVGVKMIQGFVDNRGTWYSRQAAWVVAEAAGQIYRRCGGDASDGGTLYSENLY